MSDLNIYKKENEIKLIIGNINNTLRHYFCGLLKPLYLNYINAEKSIKLNQDIRFIDIPPMIGYSLTAEGYLQNSYYSLSRVIKNYARIPYSKKLSAVIEHGCYFSEISEPDLDPTAKGIITLSNYRKEIIKKYTNKKILSIGPYIHYAELVDLQKLQKLKKKLGKVLLFFTAHSTYWDQANFDHLKVIEFLKSKSKEFDSILVCFYWKDYHPKTISMYMKNGFYCTTAGHMFDYNFLNRLKSIIYLSDVTASNAVGTHIGYCIYMNKVHWLLNQEVVYSSSSNTSNQLINDTNKSILCKEYEECTQLFQVHSAEITTAQYNFCKKMWGFDQIQTKAEMRKKLINLIK